MFLNFEASTPQCRKIVLVSPENVTVTLPESGAGPVISDLSCFKTGEPFLTAECQVNSNLTAAWENMTWHPCQLDQNTNHTNILKEYANKKINSKNVNEMAANLSIVTKEPSSLSNQDVTYAAVTLEKITYLKKLDISVINNVSNTVSNLMETDPGILGNFYYFK